MTDGLTVVRPWYASAEIRADHALRHRGAGLEEGLLGRLGGLGRPIDARAHALDDALVLQPAERARVYSLGGQVLAAERARALELPSQLRRHSYKQQDVLAN